MQKKPFSFFKGYTFTFEDEGSSIEAWFSTFSGLEKIYVDGKLLSSQRNLSTDSSSTFSVGANKYSTNLKVTSLTKGPFVCTLIKNGKEYKKQKLVFNQQVTSQPKSARILKFILYMLLGGLIGFASSFLKLPNEFLYPCLAILGLSIFIYELKKHGGSQPTIVDEDIL